jgi:FAD:protein FMN transferase
MAMQETVSRFWCMNTQIEAIAISSEQDLQSARAALGCVESLFREAERKLSRFLPDSELSALNASAGGPPFQASELLFSAMSEAIAAARSTDGWFDPTILTALQEAGYDRSFELLPADRELPARISPRRSDWRRIVLDSVSRSISLPEGCSIDLGGIGKGWTLDRTAALLAPFPGYAIDGGGDMILSGISSTGSAWEVGIEDPLAAERDLEILELTDCALATSTTARRRWRMGGRLQHHLIDPRRGRPSESGVVSATVIAPSAVKAETLAKAALLIGPGAGLRLIASNSAEGMLVLEGGYIQRTDGLKRTRRVA